MPEYGSWEPEKISTQQRIRNKLSEVLARNKDSNFLPSRDSFDSYYSYDNDPDYYSGRRRNKTPRSHKIGRLIFTGLALLTIGKAWMHREYIVDAITADDNVAGLVEEIPLAPDIPNKEEGLLERFGHFTDSLSGIFDSGANASTPTPEPKGTIEATETPQPSPTSTPVPTAEIEKTIERTSHFGVRLTFNQDEQLLSYEVDGQKTIIDQQEMQNLREKAIAEKYPQAIAVIEHEDDDATFEYTEAKPETTELPPDTLTPTELAQRGITIIQSPEVSMHIREGAFAPGELLAHHTPDSDQHLTFVLVPGPAVHPAYLEGPEYDQYRQILSTQDFDIETERSRQIEVIRQNLETQNEALTEAIESSNTDFIEIFEGNILEYTQSMEKLITADPGEIILGSGELEYAGLYNGASRTIFIAVGESNQSNSIKKTVIYFDYQGDIKFYDGQSSSFTPDLFPKADQTHPSPAEFRYQAFGDESAPMTPEDFDNLMEGDDESGIPPEFNTFPKYPYGGQNPGITVRHESDHHKFYTDHTDQSPIENIDRYFFEGTEWFTDMEAMNSIARAYYQWQNQGNDAGYYFVFQTPEEIILTQNESVSAGM